MKWIIFLISVNFYLLNCQDLGSGDGSGSGQEEETTEPFIETRPPDYDDYKIDDGGTTVLTTIDPKIARCKYLNEIRANYTICCKYPSLVIWAYQADECREECANVRKKDYRCCMLPCLYKKLGVLKFSSTDPKAKPDVDPEGLKYSFLLSVGNDTQWEPVVGSSTKRCCDDYAGASEEYSCDVVPDGLFKAIDCSVKENFLKCPPYNPHNLPECVYTREFVDECYA